MKRYAIRIHSNPIRWYAGKGKTTLRPHLFTYEVHAEIGMRNYKKVCDYPLEIVTFECTEIEKT